MFLSIHINLEPFTSCAQVCEDTAEKASSLTPDRRMPTSCRNTGDWCRKVIDEINAGGVSQETLLSCARACDRCHAACRDSILACCRECAAMCARTACICRE